VSDRLGGRYLCIAEIGAGGTAVVHRARDEQTGSEVAVKELRPQFALNRVTRRRFLQEAELAKALDHPGIVRVIDAGEDQERPFLVMELVDGESLRSLLDRVGALGEEPARQIGLALGEALDHAHRRGVIHRDVKPHNVFVLGPLAPDAATVAATDLTGRIKLGDFGQARVTALASMTGTSLAWGTPEYMPPEAFTGRRLDPRADLYALGVMLHEVATGRLPFTRAEALSRAALTRSAPRVPTPAGLSEPFAFLLDDLLAPSPRDRPEGAAAVMARLREPGRALRTRISVCPGCAAPLPADLPLCLACGRTVARFAHTQWGICSLVLEKLSDDAEALGRLLDLLGALALPTDMPITFLNDDAGASSLEEVRTAMPLPAVLFSDLDEATAQALEAIFRAEKLEVRLVRHDGSNALEASPRWAIGSSVGAVAGTLIVGGIFWGAVPAVVGATLAAVGLVIAQVARDHRRVKGQGLFRLRGHPAPVPAAEGLLAALATDLAEVRGSEGRQWLGEVGSTLYRLTRLVAAGKNRAGSLLSDRLAAALPSATRSLATLVRRVDAIDQELGKGSEAELLHQLGRLERKLTSAEPGDRVPLIGSRRELETAIDRRHCLEQERDRHTSTLGLLLGHLRETCHRLEQRPTPQVQEPLAEAERQLEAAAALSLTGNVA
jgi:hypothetical protein